MVFRCHMLSTHEAPSRSSCFHKTLARIGPIRVDAAHNRMFTDLVNAQQQLSTAAGPVQVL
jgi:hypothetical protein